jgi:hypothetical protein
MRTHPYVVIYYERKQVAQQEAERQKFVVAKAEQVRYKVACGHSVWGLKQLVYEALSY